MPSTQAEVDAAVAMFKTAAQTLVGPGPPPPPPPPSGESPQGTYVVVKAGLSNGATIIDSAGDKWTLRYVPAWGGCQVLKNAEVQNVLANQLSYCEHTVYAVDPAGFTWKAAPGPSSGWAFSQVFNHIMCARTN